MSRKNRKISNQLVYPKTQLRFAATITLIVFFSMITASAANLLLTRSILAAVEQANDPNLVAAVRALTTYNLSLLIVINGISIVSVFIVTIFITHRFLGPIVSIIRYFEDTRNAKPASLIPRKDDALGPLVEYLKTVNISVTKKGE